jgi:two-component system chemotaxis response regulator CheY
MKAIVVDDSSLVRTLIARFLRTQGFATLVEARNGVEALQQLASPQVPDLAVLDLNMPVMSGAQLVGFVRANPRFARMKVVLLTAEADRGRVPRLHRIDACVAKPFTAEKMHEVLAHLGFPVSAFGPEAIAV